MFGQIFIFIIGIFGLIVGIQTGDYFWAFCGLVTSLSGIHLIHLIYKLKTGKNIWDKSNT
jgi:hypothetical protein